MTTEISPSLGHGALFTQQGVGTDPGYDFIDFRRANTAGLQEGVIGASDFMVVQRAAGANMSVDIGMPAGGLAYVQGDTVAGQGLYAVPVHSATVNESLAASNATNPRVDQVILEVLDNVHDASGQNLARVRVLTGTPTSGATLDNRTGAIALPGSALLLADVLVGAGASSIANTKIRDRRKWARGAYFTVEGTASGDYTTTSSTLVSTGLTGYQIRVECSGMPIDVCFSGRAWNTAAGAIVFMAVMQNSVSVSAARVTSPAANETDNFLLRRLDPTPLAGSHVFGIAFSALGGGTATIQNSGSTGPEFAFRETLRQNTANNATTSG